MNLPEYDGLVIAVGLVSPVFGAVILTLFVLAMCMLLWLAGRDSGSGRGRNARRGGGASGSTTSYGDTGYFWGYAAGSHDAGGNDGGSDGGCDAGGGGDAGGDGGGCGSD